MSQRPGEHVDIREDSANRAGEDGHAAGGLRRLAPGERRAGRFAGEKGFADQSANDAVSDGIHAIAEKRRGQWKKVS